MKDIKVCIHCSATPEGSRLTFGQCKKMHIEQNGWGDIGYNLYIERDGSIHQGRPFGSILAHAKGHNKGFIAICYEGGLSKEGVSKDTRTSAQKQSLIACQNFIERIYNVTEWMGHRDLPGVVKACPSFDVKTEF